jgi:hypothetical protein
MLKIRGLRARAKQELRAKFDLKEFHDQILKHPARREYSLRRHDLGKIVEAG